MKVLLVCASILFTCWGAAISETATPAKDPVPSSFDSTHPTFIIRFTAATIITPKSGLIVMVKNGKITKLLESGTCVAEAFPPTAITFFGSRHGIYRYDDTTEKVEKYGTLDDNIIDIIKESKTDDLYILTEDHALYKVTEGGTKKTEIEDAKGATDILLDSNDNLFYFGEDNQPFVITPGGAKKIQGISVIPPDAFLSKPLKEGDGVIYGSQNGAYHLHSDGTSELIVPTEAEAKTAETKKALEELEAFWTLSRRIEKELRSENSSNMESKLK